ncbi:hypothetical protein [Methylocella tundrae]|uniref:Uncharacterized protein n=1 Tax=Methylocella tundrae TaxID=227605 RepID=A0A4U8Z4F0_METTU|nr:hypothetical protein [Methylocella tundrae]WPP04069.1 hypothetical protein SIN04_16670 [Methylocella tundrae]VFU10309.1 conserved exported protein of unknown function [Methylocella tundrae]
MKIQKSLLLSAALGFCAFGLAPQTASAQAGAPFNALDHTYRSLEDLRDESRAEAGYRKPEWVCQPAGPCVWKPGYWGPRPAARPPGAYIYVRPFDGAGWSGYYPAPPY